MILPSSAEDASLLEYEPLRTFCIIAAEASSRSEKNQIVDAFAQEMRGNDKAVDAAKIWICYVVGFSAQKADDLELLDDGRSLYRVFFRYYCEQRTPEYLTQLGKKSLLDFKIRQRATLHPVIPPNHTEPVDGGTGNEHPILTTGIRGSTNDPSLTKAKRNYKKLAYIRQIAPIDPTAEIALVPAQGEGKTLSHETESRSSGVISEPGGTECLHDDINPASHNFDAVISTSHSSASASLQTIGIQAAHETRCKQSAKDLLLHSFANSVGSAHLHAAKPCQGPASCHQDLGAFVTNGIAPHIGPEGSKVNSITAPLTNPRGTSSPDDFVNATRLQNFTSPLSLPQTLVSERLASPKQALVDIETQAGIPKSNLTPSQVAISYLITAKDVQPVPQRLSARYNSAEAVKYTSCGIKYLEDVDRRFQDAAKNAQETLLPGFYDDSTGWFEDTDVDFEYREMAAEGDMIVDEVEVENMDVQAGTTTSKPRLPSPPPIWAKELCESLDHFRSYHSGVYSRKDIVKGYLLGAFSACRDIFHHGGKLIISHGGGKAESLLASTTGRRLQSAQDQTATDKSVRALLKNYKEKRLLVLLADDKYVQFPYDLSASGYTYVVLGIYWISHAWAEYQPADESSRIVRWKFAFQWCESQGIPWWLNSQELEKTPQPSHCGPQGTASSDCSTETTDFECQQCLQKSPLVYKQIGMCLNPTCVKFWTADGEEPQKFEYREEFLKLLPHTFGNLPRVRPTIAGRPIHRCHGWHCDKCGRLSSRYKWECWECAHCHACYAIDGRIRLASEFWNQRLPSVFLHSRINKNSGIFACRPQPIDLGKGRGFTNRLTFVLPFCKGKIHLILGTPLSNGEANIIFEQYQRQAFAGELKLRRYPLRTHRARGTLLTNYFSQNSGEPYQYVGGTENTVPFTEAPACVGKALDLIKEKAQLGLQLDEPFNEVLSAAYLERQKMSFHSDSEKGLGPVVASLSLGSAALMHFRPHTPAEFPKQNQLALSLILRHGDVLIMEGHDVQIHYEHTVIPFNFRIAATARYINSASL